MTKAEAIAKYVLSLIDEIAPSETVDAMNYNETIEEIMQSVANEYVMAYPVESVVTKVVRVTSAVDINRGNRIQGSRVILNTRFPNYLKFRELVIHYPDGRYPDVFITELLPLNSKQRMYIDGDNYKSLSVMDTIVFYGQYPSERTAFLDIFPQLYLVAGTDPWWGGALAGDNLQIKYDSSFDPETSPVSGTITGEVWNKPGDDRGFFDNFCWYLAYRTMQVMGANSNMIQAANEKVQAHFEMIKNLP